MLKAKIEQTASIVEIIIEHTVQEVVKELCTSNNASLRFFQADILVHRRLEIGKWAIENTQERDGLGKVLNTCLNIF